LEDSIKRFEEGMNLIRFCSKKLDEAEQKVTMLIREGDDQYREVPFLEDKSGDG
ncbi:MAG TPA: exodeoxyribonuclease VII small subunit, partial [Desulfobacteraceae bacterium]|nr:exodeoxyribonuclease VII small subunit [Desulfobacteraceae bacterium]